jgi:hypothetical protein
MIPMSRFDPDFSGLNGFTFKKQGADAIINTNLKKKLGEGAIIPPF